MNALLNVVPSGPLAQAVGWALLHLSWQGVLVAGMLAASLALMKNRSANARYLASCGALALLIAMPVATAWQAYETPLPPAPPLVARTLVDAGATFGGMAGLSAPQTTPAASSDRAWMERTRERFAAARAYLPQVVLIWLIGVAFLSLRLLYGWMEAQRLARDGAMRASNEWEAAVARIAAAMQLRRAVRLLASARVEVPTVVGWLRPVILLPVATLSGLSPQQVEMVLAHELAHIRRHDFFVNLLQAVVETLLFYHPAVWWISRQVRIERENCCDDLAISVCGNALQYARALTRLEELRIDPPQIVLAANGGSLIARIRRLVPSRAESTLGPSRWAAGLALVTVLVALLAMPAMPLFARLGDEKPAEKRSRQATKEKDKPASGSEIDVHARKTDGNDARQTADERHDADAEADDDDGDDADDNADDNADEDGGGIEMSVGDEDELDAAAIPPAPPVPAAPPAPAVRATPAAAPAAPAPPASPAPPAPAAAPAPIYHYRSAAEAGITLPTIDLAPIVEPAVTAALAGMEVGLRQLSPTEVDDVRERERERPDVKPARSGRKQRFSDGGKLSVDELIALRTVGVTPEYIAEMRKNAGLGELSLDDLYAMRIHGVTADYLRELRAAGVTVATGDDAVKMRIHGVTGSFVRDIAAAGYRNLSSDDLVGLRIHGVTPEFIKTLTDAGYTNLTARELRRLRSSGVNADFIRELARYRTKQ